MQEKYKAILLIGPPGSGKGTVGKKLAAVTGQLHLSSGEIFRAIPKDTEMGKLQRKYTDKGMLIPDPLTIEIILNFLRGLTLIHQFSPEKQIIILDGVPRTLKQAEIMQEYFDLEAVIVLDVSDKTVLFDRLKKRALIERRTDDRDDKILEDRYAVYKNQTEVLLSFYPKGIQKVIQADQTQTKVFRDVLIEVADLF